MQQYVTATVFSATLIVSALAAAAEPIPQTQVEYNQQPQQVYYYQQPAPQAQPQYYSAQPAERPTFFGRMMDLERRKNNAILRFFGLR